VCVLAGVAKSAGASFDARGPAVDQNDGGAGGREGSGDDFTDLSFGTDAGKEDRGSLEH
jgi:hypothetical protein